MPVTSATCSSAIALSSSRRMRAIGSGLGSGSSPAATLVASWKASSHCSGPSVRMRRSRSPSMLRRKSPPPDARGSLTASMLRQSPGRGAVGAQAAALRRAWASQRWPRRTTSSTDRLVRRQRVERGHHVGHRPDRLRRSTASMRSPGFTPALAAAPPGVDRDDLDRGLRADIETVSPVIPSQPWTTRPSAMRSPETTSASQPGVATRRPRDARDHPDQATGAVDDARRRSPIRAGSSKRLQGLEQGRAAARRADRRTSSWSTVPQQVWVPVRRPTQTRATKAP